MEQQIWIRCRKEDEELIKSVEDDAIQEYKKLLISEVKKFKD